MAYVQANSGPPPPGYGGPPPRHAGGPPPPGYGAPPPGYGQTPVYRPVITGMSFGEHPISFKCQYCGADIITRTTAKLGNMTWAGVGICCLVGCFFGGITWLGCCLIPCCVNSLKDVEHSCPNCNRVVGKYDRMK